MGLTGTVVLVTDSGRGVGRRVALHLAQRGAAIVAHHAGSKGGAEGGADGIVRQIQANPHQAAATLPQRTARRRGT